MNNHVERKGYEKNAFYRFFEIFKNKFFKILGINAIFFTAFLVTVSIAIFTSQFIVKSNLYILLPLCFLPMVALGPVIASITRMCRDFTREVPGFFWNDFILGIKRNWKQGLQLAGFQYLFFWLLYIAIPFYYGNITANSFNILPFGFSLLVALLFLFMNYHMYMMAVSLDLTFIEILKNSLIFCFACLLKNLLITVLLVLYIGFFAFLTFAFVIPFQNAILWGFLLIFIMLLFFGFIFYLVSFISYPCIDRYILTPYYKEHPEETSASAASSSKSDKIQELPSNMSEYVYHNGKLVHRSAFQSERLFQDREESEKDKD